MSLLTWLTKPAAKVVLEDVDPILPDPAKESTAEKQAEVTTINKEVAKAVVAEVKTRKRKSYAHYDDELKARIGRFAAENGNKAAVDKFSRELDRPLMESSVRNFKKKYYAELRVVGEPSKVTVLPRLKAGRPTVLPAHIESAVKDYLCKLRQNGGIVNKTVVISAATGTVEHHDKSLLKKYGGVIDLNRYWAESFMSRMGLVKRKATKAARKLPDDFDTVKTTFLDSIRSVVTEHQIPPALIINWDQTGVRLVPSSEWTMAEVGSKQVEVHGLGDKREITVLLAITLSGALLPPQLLYAGKTDRCHPHQQFPDSWDVYHTENHWSNENSMLHFIDHVISPYVAATRQSLQLPETQPALCIFDVFAAHRVESVRNKLRDANIQFLYVPGGCTGELQPLDKAFNHPYKKALKDKFSGWYAGEVKRALDEDRPVEVDLKTSVMKEHHARWLISVHSDMETEADLIKSGFVQAGISAVASIEQS